MPSDTPNFDYLFKFIVVGPSGVGKSAILLQFTDHEFNDQHEITLGVEFGVRLLEIDDTKVKIQIWDTAGQESFRSITNNYYRSTHAALLVYDITVRDTFQSMKGWLDEILHHSDPNITIILIGNKCDIQDKRVVPRSEGEQFAKDYGLLFLETSAKKATNIETAFQTACRLVHQKVKSNKIKVESGKTVQLPKGPTDSTEKKAGCCK